SLTVNLPTVSDSQIVIVQMCLGNGGSGAPAFPTITPPSGYTLIRRDSAQATVAGSQADQAWYWHRWLNGDTTSPVFSFTSIVTPHYFATASVWDGCITTGSPIAAHNGQTSIVGTQQTMFPRLAQVSGGIAMWSRARMKSYGGAVVQGPRGPFVTTGTNTTMAVAPSVTTQFNNGLVLVGMMFGNESSTPTVSWPAVTQDQAQFGDGSPDVAWLGHFQQGEPGTTAPQTATSSVAGTYAAAQIALTPKSTAISNVIPIGIAKARPALTSAGKGIALPIAAARAVLSLTDSAGVRLASVAAAIIEHGFGVAAVIGSNLITRLADAAIAFSNVFTLASAHKFLVPNVPILAQPKLVSSGHD